MESVQVSSCGFVCEREESFRLKGHSQLMHIRIKYRFLADLHVTTKAYPEYSKQTL